jgi:hypothetical protein
VDVNELVIETRRGSTPGAWEEPGVPEASPGIPRPDLGLGLKVCWIAARLIAVFYLGQQGATFFYQGF